MKESGLTRWRILLGAIIIQLILGTVYGYSIFWTPLQSKIFPQVVTQEELKLDPSISTESNQVIVVADQKSKEAHISVQKGYLKYAFSICILSFALTMVFAGRIQDVKGPRFTATIGGVLMGLGFILSSLVNHFIIFYLAHAIFCGLVTVLLLMVYHAFLGKADPEKKPLVKYVPMGIVTTATVSGVLLGQKYLGQMGEYDQLFMLWGTIGFLAGAGIGFAYVCPIAALIKWFPEKKGLVSGVAVAGFGFGAYLFTRDSFGAMGFLMRHDIHQFFMIHGVICLVGISFGAMLLKNPKNTVASSASTDSSWQDTLKSPAFYIIWLMFFSGAVAGLMVIGILKGFAGEQLNDMAKGAAAVGWLAIFNAAGRVAWGFCSDKIGRTVSFVAMFLFQAVTLFLLGSMTSELSLAVTASIIGFNFGGNFALFPSITADFFGAKNLGANYGLIFTSYGIAGVVGIAAGNAAKSMTGSYTVAFSGAAVLCLVSAVLAVILKVSQTKKMAYGLARLKRNDFHDQKTQSFHIKDAVRRIRNG